MTYKKEEVEKKVPVIVGVKCDSCKKEEEALDVPRSWCDISAMHHEWGNDSFESSQDYHACSPECYFEILMTINKEFKNRHTTEIRTEMGKEFMDDLIEYAKYNSENS